MFPWQRNSSHFLQCVYLSSWRQTLEPGISHDGNGSLLPEVEIQMSEFILIYIQLNQLWLAAESSLLTAASSLSLFSLSLSSLSLLSLSLYLSIYLSFSLSLSLTYSKMVSASTH